MKQFKNWYPAYTWLFRRILRTSRWWSHVDLQKLVKSGFWIWRQTSSLQPPKIFIFLLGDMLLTCVPLTCRLFLTKFHCCISAKGFHCIVRAFNGLCTYEFHPNWSFIVHLACSCPAQLGSSFTTYHLVHVDLFNSYDVNRPLNTNQQIAGVCW